MFEIFLSGQSRKFLKKLDAHNSKRIVSAIERIRIRPHSHVKKLVASPYFRLRVGDYRVILDIKDKELIIIVIEIGNRKNIYK